MVLDNNTNFYEKPEWLRWKNTRKLCAFCGKPIKWRFTYCGLHAKLFKKPEVKIIRR